jgi:EmrB/QacA subfamily drug resistance transporter
VTRASTRAAGDPSAAAEPEATETARTPPDPGATPRSTRNGGRRAATRTPRTAQPSGTTAAAAPAPRTRTQRGADAQAPADVAATRRRTAAPDERAGPGPVRNGAGRAAAARARTAAAAPSPTPARPRPTAAPPQAAEGGPPPAAAAPAHDDMVLSGGRWVLPLMVIMIGSFMAVLDTSIVNVAIPRLQNDFGASTDQVQWVATAYTLALGIVTPLTGWLGDRYGLDRVQNAALVLFVAGSALCGLAASLNMLIGFRIFQAIGGGLLPAVSQAMVYRLVPRDKIGTAMGLYGFGVVVAPAVGPTIGGYLVEYVNWRLIFYINVPIGVVAVVLSYLLLPRFPRISGQRFDYAGFITIAVGLFALLLALSEGETWHWTAYSTLMLIALGVLSLALFVVVELSVAEPMLDLRVFRSSTFTISSFLVAILSTGLFAGLFYVPLWLQQGQDLGAFQTGLTLLLPAVMTVIMMPISGRLYDRIGARWPAVIGLALVAWSSYLMHSITPDTTREQFILWLSLRNLGTGLAFMPIMAGSISVLPTRLISRASAINNIVLRVSSALGVAVLTAVLTSQQAQQLSNTAGLLPAVNPGSPAVQGISSQGTSGVLGLYNGVGTQIFGTAVGNLFLLTAGLTAVGVLLALMLPQRRRASGGAPAAHAEMA